MKALVIRTLAILCALAPASVVSAQCTNYTITVGGGFYDYEIDWELVNELGTVVASGYAPTTLTTCQPDGCFQFNLYDTFGDGWNGATYTVAITATGAVVGSGTLIDGGFSTMQVSLGGGCSSGNCEQYTMVVTAGLYPTEISWNLVNGSNTVASGYAPTSLSLCLDTGCFTLQMFDDFGDGWDGAIWTLNDDQGNPVQTGQLSTGAYGQSTFPLGVPSTNCTNSGPVTASDCPDAVNICTNISFSIDPNGIGTMNEIPPLGSVGNPLLYWGDGTLSPWGSDNEGCLQNNELNSTWMVVNIAQGGLLEFTFGGLGTQAGFYDWIMYPYSASTCSDIPANTQAPVTCNWNWVSFGGTGLAATVPGGGDPGNYEPPLAVQTGEQYLICFSNWSSVSTVVPLQFGGTAEVSCEPVILPIELVSFDAGTVQGGIELYWRTASEMNTSHFVVERSIDHVDWQRIGEVGAAGSSFTALDYRYMDTYPKDGLNCYRLRMVDLDGTEEITPTAQATWGAMELFVYPNPNDGTFRVHGVGGAFEVIDATGRSVRSLVLNPGSNDPIMQLNAPGIYTLVSTDGSHNSSTRIVVFE